MLHAANEDNGPDEGMDAYEWTERTASTNTLKTLFMRNDIAGHMSPLETDLGAWCAEYGNDGELARWRFYRSPWKV